MSPAVTGTPATATVLMMLADARLPVGGHVHSAGLEPALAAGMPPSRVFDYLLGRAHSVSLVEAGTAVVAKYVCLSAPGDRVSTDLAMVESAWAARTPSRALREVSRSLGRGYLRLATRLWPGHPGIDACSTASVPLSRPVVVGAIAAAANLNSEGLVRLVIYDDAQTVAAALLKLAPIDPAIAAGWVLRACAAVDHLVPDIATLTSSDAIPSSGSPQNEEWAESHSLTTQRLFRA